MHIGVGLMNQRCLGLKPNANLLCLTIYFAKAADLHFDDIHFDDPVGGYF